MQPCKYQELLIVKVGKGGAEIKIAFPLVFLEINKNIFYPLSFLSSYRIIPHLTDSNHEIILSFVWGVF